MMDRVPTICSRAESLIYATCRWSSFLCLVNERSVSLLARMSMDVDIDGRTLIHEVVLAYIKADRLVHIA